MHVLYTFLYCVLSSTLAGILVLSLLGVAEGEIAYSKYMH